MAATAAMSMCTENCTNAGILYEFATNEMWAQWNAVADYFEYQPWIFSLLGSAMVGLSGVLPLLVIPIDEGANLKNGAGAGTLKILLSFAVGGLLGDVFLHLLPEAWASKALNIAHADGHRPMACGLWVLAGFLVFIIAEKMFIGEGEGDQNEEELDQLETDDVTEKNHEFLNNNDHKELENNNCLTLNVSSSKNDLSKLKCKYSKVVEDVQSSIGTRSRLNETKNGYAIAPIAIESRKNGFIKNSKLNDCSSTEEKQANGFIKTDHRANGFTKIPSNIASEEVWKVSTSTSSALKKNLTTRNERSRSPAPAKQNTKHITGYLNLMANCIDNFTHGLAVGGSFLISFRLGALTTFAILIHEIPHEVGDFAILLKSGFNRWDAARAQLLTASGGIFGALVAVMCSGSGIESRTSWILPFTAGGFLHIGLVTVLPELLKESNPKESMKQLGALLSGITVMAMLTMLCD